MSEAVLCILLAGASEVGPKEGDDRLGGTSFTHDQPTECISMETRTKHDHLL